VALILLATVAAVVSLVVRFRRSQGEERLQLKWFTFAGLLPPPASPSSATGCTRSTG